MHVPSEQTNSTECFIPPKCYTTLRSTYLLTPQHWSTSEYLFVYLLFLSDTVALNWLCLSVCVSTRWRPGLDVAGAVHNRVLRLPLLRRPKTIPVNERDTQREWNKQNMSGTLKLAFESYEDYVLQDLIWKAGTNISKNVPFSISHQNKTQKHNNNLTPSAHIKMIADLLVFQYHYSSKVWGW